MRLLPVLFILTLVEANRRRLERDQVDVNRRVKANDVDVYPERFEGAVDFGHVSRNTDRKGLPNTEPDMIEPRSVEHARQLLRQSGSDIFHIKKPEIPLGFSNPRDEMQYNNPIRKTSNDKNIRRTKTKHRPPENSQTIRKAVAEEIKKKYPGNRSNSKDRSSSDDIPFGTVSKYNSDDHKEKFFAKDSFDLMSNETSDIGNWTTCKQFAKGAVFHPDDVINIPWVPFYIWSTRRFVSSFVHTLSYPTKKLVKQYKKEFGPYLNMNLNWEQHKLLLKESKDILLIAGDRKGLFYGIPYVELPTPVKNFTITLPVIIIRFKIIDPYLAMMYCNEKYATIMSVAGSEPETDAEKIAEAAILKFQGLGNAASRDLELEALQSSFEMERKRRKEENKYIKVETPDDTLDPSLW